MVNERARAYAEVYTIIKMMDKKYRDRLPKRMKEIIIEEMDKEYVPHIDAKIPLKNQNLCRKTYTILAMLNLNYWCEDIKHKYELIQIYEDNEAKEQQQKREKYNHADLFQNDVGDKAEKNLQMVKYEEESFFKKVITKLKNFFKKN